MLPMASMNAVMYSHNSIKTNQLIKKRNKDLKISNFFFFFFSPENCIPCSENLILALAIGSIFLSDKKQHSIHEHEKKQSPKCFAENPPLLMFHPYESYLKPALKIIKVKAYCHFLAFWSGS